MGIRAKAVFTNASAGYCVTIYKNGKPEYFGHFTSKPDVNHYVKRAFGDIPIKFTTLKKGGK